MPAPAPSHTTLGHRTAHNSTQQHPPRRQPSARRAPVASMAARSTGSPTSPASTCTRLWQQASTRFTVSGRARTSRCTDEPSTLLPLLLPVVPEAPPTPATPSSSITSEVRVPVLSKQHVVTCAEGRGAREVVGAAVSRSNDHKAEQAEQGLRLSSLKHRASRPSAPNLSLPLPRPAAAAPPRTLPASGMRKGSVQ